MSEIPSAAVSDPGKGVVHDRVPPAEHQEQRVEEFVTAFRSLRREVGKVIVGHDDVINHVLIGLFAGGHVLLEGVPGLGKTLLVQTLAECLELTFSRIQFTPDLMPGDIIGTNIIVEDAEARKHFQFQRGPIFGAHPARRRDQPRHAEDAVGAARGHAGGRGHRLRRGHPLPAPFFVLATQNPIEMEGTYPLPEAQLDRFLFKLRVRYPALEELAEIIDRTTHVPRGRGAARDDRARGASRFRELVREVPIAAHVRDLALYIVLATHPQWERPRSRPGASSATGRARAGAQALVLGAKVRALCRGALQRQRRGPPRHGAPRAPPPAHPELRGRGRGRSTSTASSTSSSRPPRRWSDRRRKTAKRFLR